MPHTVLIVDDHPSFRSTARMLLESEGFDVIGEAEELPDTDGFAVARSLLASGATAAIVLTSSRDGCDFGSLIAESGARGFVPKGELSGAAIAELLG
jgi:DNA-binding NarL/FixJ family response regulator